MNIIVFFIISSDKWKLGVQQMLIFHQWYLHKVLKNRKIFLSRFCKEMDRNTRTPSTHTQAHQQSNVNRKKGYYYSLLFFIFHFVTIQIMFTWTLIGRSHIGLHQMLKTIKRVSKGRRGLSEQGEIHWTMMTERTSGPTEPPKYDSLTEDITSGWGSGLI